ncbi:MAG: hypothetical protein KBD01_09255 [Acidobacteria bacterium]|nr:hypothetical protein [Acidobacteriota bacterium]
MSRQKSLLLLLLAAALLTAAGCATAHPAPVPGASRVASVIAADDLDDKWGVEVVSLRSAAEGMMLDFRFRVLEPDKAAPLLAQRTSAYLVDPERNVKLTVPSTPKAGQLRNTIRVGLPRQGAVYYVLFGNPNRVLVPGDKVNVVIGDFQAEDIVIQ